MFSSETGSSLVAQLVKSPPAMWETLVRSPGLGWEDPLEGLSESNMTEQLSMAQHSKETELIGDRYVQRDVS